MTMDYTMIKIGEKNYPLKFGNNASRIFQIETGKNIMTMIAKLAPVQPEKKGKGKDKPAMPDAIAITEIFGPNELIHLAYAGLKDGHRKAQAPFDLTVDDVADLLDEEPGALTDIFVKFSESLLTTIKGTGQKKTEKIVM